MEAYRAYMAATSRTVATTPRSTSGRRGAWRELSLMLDAYLVYQCSMQDVIDRGYAIKGELRKKGLLKDQPQQEVKMLDWARVRKSDGCWTWLGGVDRKGYGQVTVRRPNGQWGTERAHRLAYVELVGPIPEGLVLDHVCRNHRCVNPAHLEPVTHLENVRRGERATKTHCINGHEFTPENTRITYDKDGRHRRCRVCVRLATRRWRARQTNPK